MSKKATASAICVMIVAAALAGCAGPAGDPRPIGLPGELPCALAIETSQPARTVAEIGALVAGSARGHEHVAIFDDAVPGKVLGSSVSPGAPTMAGPVPPGLRPGAGATKFQRDAYQHKLAKYQAKVAHDEKVLERALASRLRSWSAETLASVSHSASRARSGAGARTDLSPATAYFASLQQAGVNLGSRRVIVIFATRATSDENLQIAPGSLAGTTVIVTGFRGDLTEQAEWQTILLRAGASRAAVLVPAATRELAALTRFALAGGKSPAPVQVRFRLGSAGLQSAGRAALGRLAAALTTTFPAAHASILGFGDSRRGEQGQDALSRRRAMTVRTFLEARGVAASRLVAAGYGTDLADPQSSGQDASGSASQEVVVIIDLVR